MSVATRLKAELGGRYDIGRELGRGGMAVVYQAQDLKHGRQVAIKVLRPELSATLAAERFLREIEIAARLQHPHILPLHDSGSADGLLYYVMPFVEGETLRQRIARERQLPVADALQIVREVAGALGHAHAHDVIHRDIKPENILLSGGHAMVADFGVAAAISEAAGESLTDSGVAVGTPAYMSPEQGTGAGTVDARSDIYALGCVLFEMLVGEPPFTGATPQTVIARHVSQTPPGVRAVRPTVPAGVEDALDRALAKVPADRFQSATEFADALERPFTSDAYLPDTRGVPARRRRVRAGLLAGAAVAVASALVLVLLPGRPALNRSLYAVATFDHGPGTAPALLDGDDCQWRLTEALRRWEGVTTVDRWQLIDAALRRGEPLQTNDDWMRAARSVGAGMLVRSEVTQLGDTIHLAATLVDVARRAEAGRAVATASSQDGILAAFHDLAAQLLGLEQPPGVVGDWGSRSLEAVRTFLAADDAVQRGEFRAAAARFAEATRYDPRFADAHLWGAQVMAWDGAPPDVWAASARRAVELGDRLAPPLRRLALPLLHLAEGRFAQACDEYRRILAGDSTAFEAWIGLGECESRDNVVVRDPGSPSGWSFRGSYHAAIDAYRRALQRTPFLTSAFYDRLTRLLPTEPHQYRAGVAASPDTARFWAAAELHADTFAFVPYPLLDMRLARAPASGRLRNQALVRGGDVLRTVVRQWVAAYPRSADAHIGLAHTLEALGEIRPRPGEESALSAVRDAARLARTPGESLRVALTETRLLLKTDQFARAQALADSLLRAVAVPDSHTVESLAALALLTGRPGHAADVLTTHLDRLEDFPPDPQLRRLPRPLLDAQQRLLAYATVGAPREQLEPLVEGFEAQLASLIEPQRREVVRRGLLDDIATVAYPTLGTTRVHRRDAPNYMLAIQALLAAGDTAGVRSEFEALRVIREDIPAGDVAPWSAYLEALALLAVEDSAAARGRLDASLSALSTLNPRLLWQDLLSAGTVVRAMALRAELAASVADAATTRRWAGAVAALWSGGDPVVEPTVERMRALMP